MNAATEPPAIVQQVSEDDMPALNDTLRLEYATRYGLASLRRERDAEASRGIKRIIAGRPRYEIVARDTAVPWFVIGAIHSLECDSRFDCHLHNGNPLTARTKDRPAGRPVVGEPPFTWEYSATDALLYERNEGGWKYLSDKSWADWGVSATLYKLEAYNGFGSRMHNIKTPYLWGGTQLYVRGKYTRDGEWNGYAVSKQIGAAILLKIMSQEGVMPFPPNLTPAPICETQ